MTKVKVGERPVTFKRTVKFPLLEGGEGAIEMIYKYRSRTEYGDFVDSWQESRTAKADAQAQEQKRTYDAAVKAATEAGEEPPPFPVIKSGDFQRKVSEAMADFIVEIAEGWDLEKPFCAASVLELADTRPAAAEAIQSAYRVALTEGRLGN